MTRWGRTLCLRVFNSVEFARFLAVRLEGMTDEFSLMLSNAPFGEQALAARGARNRTLASYLRL